MFFFPDLFGAGAFFWPDSFGQLTAANGDYLLFKFGDDLYHIDPNGSVISPLTIIGGSGRFQNATGSANMMFIFDWDTGEVCYLMDGSIDY